MYRFARPDKRRPVLVLSRQRAIEHLRTAIVAPITTTIRGLPSEVPLGFAEGLKEECVVNLDHLYTVAQADLRAFVGTVSPSKLASVCSGLAIALGCA
jgi:mRNA interferase MazF